MINARERILAWLGKSFAMDQQKTLLQFLDGGIAENVARRWSGGENMLVRGVTGPGPQTVQASLLAYGSRLQSFSWPSGVDIGWPVSFGHGRPGTRFRLVSLWQVQATLAYCAVVLAGLGTKWDKPELQLDNSALTATLEVRP